MGQAARSFLQAPFIAVDRERNFSAKHLLCRATTGGPYEQEISSAADGCFASGGSVVCANPPATDRPNNNAVNSSDQKNSNKPVAGANSFTEGQAKSKIEDAGYSNVTSLKKDDKGIWRGKASKGGASTDVSLDFQGNVNAAK